MKMGTGNTTTIERIGVGADQEFTIDFSAKMASILADGLYSDKIQSVIRELSCNAYDSQVAAGRADTPIEVHFPNRFEPWFHVRDFGTGLSHDEVMTIYTRYGASTKTNSNDFIGALGLGSKSPFAITEAFTVTARKDGIENHYSMYRNEQGMPSVAHLHQAATAESNGVTVTVPVREDQRGEFIEKSKQVYKWFPVKPNTIGDSIAYDAITYEYQGTGWGIRKAQQRRSGYYGYQTSNERPVAIMGLVAYPLDVSSVKKLSEGARQLLETPVVLTFNIGELEIAANREALGYDERTCAAIVAKMDTMVSELGAVFEQQIAGADTLWNAHKKFGEIFNTGNYSYQFSKAFRNLGLNWKSTVIKDHHQSFVASKLYGVTDTKYANCDFYIANHNYKRPRKVSLREDESYQIECTNNVVIIYNDVKLGGLTRVAEYNKVNEGRKRIFIFPNHDKVTVDKIRSVLGNPEIVLTSSLPRPERKKVQRAGVYLFVGGYGRGKKVWKEAEINLEDGGYYVDLDGWDHVWNGKHIGEISWWIQKGIDAGIVPQGTSVYAMRSKNKKFVVEHSKWCNLIDRVKEGIESLIRKRNIGRDLAYSEEYSRLCSVNHVKLWDFENEVKDPTSPLINFIETVKKYKSASKGLDSLQVLANRFEIEVKKEENHTNLVSEWNRIMDRYPMLHFAVDRYWYSRLDDTSKKRMFDYINHVDSTAIFTALQDREEDN